MIPNSFAQQFQRQMPQQNPSIGVNTQGGTPVDPSAPQPLPPQPAPPLWPAPPVSAPPIARQPFPQPSGPMNPAMPIGPGMPANMQPQMPPQQPNSWAQTLNRYRLPMMQGL